MKKWTLFILASLLACALMAEPMPEFRLPDETGKNVALTDLLGKGPVVVDFWADYCQPCKQAMPDLNALAEKYDSLAVVLVSIDAPKMQGKAKNFLKSKNFKFITLFDPDKTLAKKLNVVNPPHTFILDKSGEIVYSHVGYEAGAEVEYEKQIRKLWGLLEPCGRETPCADCAEKEAASATQPKTPCEGHAESDKPETKTPCGSQSGDSTDTKVPCGNHE